MKSEAFVSLGRVLAGALLFLLVGGLTPLLPSAAPKSNSRDSLNRTRSNAETQHEIVMLLLKKREYEKAATEANRIFEMSWPESQEPLLLKELLILSDRFLRQGQASVGLQIIEKNSKRFIKTSSRIEILKEEGYLRKSLHQDDKAMECFRKAQELEHPR
jgi:hypothetical protein